MLELFHSLPAWLQVSAKLVGGLVLLMIIEVPLLLLGEGLVKLACSTWDIVKRMGDD